MVLIDNTSESDIDEEEEVTMIRNIELEGDLIAKNLLPKKSCEKYEKVHEDFQNWCIEFNVKTYTEPALLVYFDQLSKKFKPSSLWSRWSMLKTTLGLRDNIRLDNFYNLKAFLKSFGRGYRSKKAKVFTWSQIVQFLEGSDDLIYLAMKIILIFGICGALRCHEICNIRVNDIEDTGSQFVVTIRDTKNYYPRTFVIGPQLYQKVKQYIALRPTDFESDRFFIVYQKGKCSRNMIGKNKVSDVPKSIASYLNLDDVKLYTGHSFRRTEATLLSNSGANLVDVKSLGGWKYDAVVQGYIDNSLANKRKIFEGIVNSEKALNFPDDAKKSGKSFLLQQIHNLPHLNENSRTRKRTVDEEAKQVPSVENVENNTLDGKESGKSFSSQEIHNLPGCSKQKFISNIDSNENNLVGKRRVIEILEQVSYEQIENEIPDCDVRVNKKKKVSRETP